MEPNSHPGEFTRALRRLHNGDETAHDELFEMAYVWLRGMVRAGVRGRRPESIDPTEVVHELYLKISRGGPILANDRRHFLNIAARAMHQVLVDLDEHKHAQKRGGDVPHLPLASETVGISADGAEPDWAGLDRALAELGEIDPQAREAIMLRHICGLTNTETAEAMGLNVAKVRRLSSYAKAWLVTKLASEH